MVTYVSRGIIMKNGIFLSVIFFSAMSSAEIKLSTISGINAVHLYKNKIQIIEVDLSSAQKLKFVFMSTDKTGTPKVTFRDGSVYDVPLVSGAQPLLQVKEPVELSVDINQLQLVSGYERVFKVGIDGNNDGGLLTAEDDFYSIAIKAL